MPIISTELFKVVPAKFIGEGGGGGINIVHCYSLKIEIVDLV